MRESSRDIKPSLWPCLGAGAEPPKLVLLRDTVRRQEAQLAEYRRRLDVSARVCVHIRLCVYTSVRGVLVYMRILGLYVNSLQTPCIRVCVRVRARMHASVRCVFCASVGARVYLASTVTV